MVVGAERTCQFTLEPDGDAEEHLSGVLDADDVWRCHREPMDDSSYCVFHRPRGEVAPEARTAAFLETVLADPVDDPVEARRRRQFIGATFSELALGFAVLAGESNHAIDLRYAEFDELFMEYASVGSPVLLTGATFHDTVSLRDATFDADVHLRNATFEAGVDCSDATFEDDVTASGAGFGGAAVFDDATFEGELDVSAARFGDGASFVDASFAGDTCFDSCAATTLCFADATFNDRLSLRDVESLEPGSASPELQVDARRAHISAGRISTAGIEADLTDATIGDVSFEAPTDGDVFGSLRVWNTSFDGFEFDGYRDGLHTRGWEIHSDADGVADRPSDRGRWLSELEDTYRLAKQGASSAGDTKASAEFFRQEMTARRRHHAYRALDASNAPGARLKAAGQWATNTLMDVTSGHGERPSRPIVASVATIALFTGLFSVLIDNPAFGPLGYVVLGMESFVTLVLVGSPPVNDLVVQTLAQVEAFIGAYLLALFVFTLSRSVHR